MESRDGEEFIRRLLLRHAHVNEHVLCPVLRAAARVVAAAGDEAEEPEGRVRPEGAEARAAYAHSSSRRDGAAVVPRASVMLAAAVKP